MSSRFAVITFLDGPGGSIDNTLPGAPVYPSGGPIYGGGYPSQGLPWAPGHPGNVLPPPGSIATLPVFPFDPTKPVDPDKPEPPDTKPPIQIKPGGRFIVKWLACHGLILVPDHELPETPEPK